MLQMQTRQVTICPWTLLTAWIKVTACCCYCPSAAAGMIMIDAQFTMHVVDGFIMVAWNNIDWIFFSTHQTNESIRSTIKGAGMQKHTHQQLNLHQVLDLINQYFHHWCKIWNKLALFIWGHLVNRQPTLTACRFSVHSSYRADAGPAIRFRWACWQHRRQCMMHTGSCSTLATRQANSGSIISE